MKEKKNVQSSGWLCFSAGSNYNRKKLRPEKKGTVIWPMEAAQIWRERYDRKKTYSCLASYVFQQVQITTGKNYDRKKKVQLSGRHLETGKKIRPEKKVQSSGCRLEDKTQNTTICFFLIPKQSTIK
jgi:hypothetical protein